MGRDFDELVSEATSASVAGWDFAWLDGRATEERPSWQYSKVLADRMSRARASLDIQTGGGEVLASAPVVPPLAAATESWPPNIALATARLGPKGIVVVADPDEPPLPFGAGAFDLVTSRHPNTVWWGEIARVLSPGGSYVAQHVGPSSVFELVEFFLGEQSDEVRNLRHPDHDIREAKAAGLTVDDVRLERLRVEFRDIGAVVYFLRKVIWMVPGFTTDAYLPQLRELHARIQPDGAFVAHSTRFLIEARKPHE
jgi:SAM-dependent methyltransferase